MPALRKLDGLIVRSQRPPKGTEWREVRAGSVPAEWVRGSGAGGEGVILSLHGGAFVTGSPATHRELMARISQAAGVEVLSVGYRLAPEHPFPAAIQDTLEVYQWLLEEGHASARIVLGGESSGGGLALQALLIMKREEIPLPKAAFFLSPVTDWVGLDGESYQTRARRDPLLARNQCRATAALYVGDHPADDTLLRPATMDLTGLPPMWIQVGDHEILLSDAQRLAERGRQNGVEVDFKAWPGMWHVFQSTARWVPEARGSVRELGRFVRSQLGINAAGLRIGI